MPLDHFNSSDTRTFNQRLFVNDTYYKPGGPVIFFDLGETAVEDQPLAEILAEWNGTVSAPMELAKSLNGVVVCMEHRYYGSSHPFPLNYSTLPLKPENIDILQGYSGIPLGGPADYRYLSVEQALEDVVYLATEIFNKTELGANNTVLSVVNATQRLDPYHTPWIFVGGSYPGNRGAWLRLRNPEVIYAVWASSAPVETQPDGSAYYNSIYRALPRNCTSDIQAVVKATDNALYVGGADSLYLKTMVYMYSNGPSASAQDLAEAANQTDFDVASLIFSQSVFGLVQDLGVHDTIQQFCDIMETFDAASYLSNSSLASSDLATRASVFLYNTGGTAPSADGIVASNPNNASEVGVAAYLYALNSYKDIYIGLLQGTAPTSLDALFEDAHSWEWQVLTEIGLITGVNASSPFALGSALISVAANRASDLTDVFPGFDAATTFPPEPDTSYPDSFGGWNMRPSNTMFTNGEFDPWRAFGVMSLDQDLGAPSRAVTQTVPRCGQPPAGTDVFGLLYGGAVHAEDMWLAPGQSTGSIDTDNPPVKQGAALFVEAYNSWLACFNASRP